MEPKGVLAKMSAAIVFEKGYKPINCIMYYDQTAPFEVMFASDEETEDGQTAEWHYSRDLLAQAIRGEENIPYGDGDVQIFKAAEFIYTLLTSAGQKCMVAFMVEDMKIFFNSTLDLVPLGSEAQDVDAAIAELLRDNEPPF